jgi:hypothetical protein
MRYFFTLILLGFSFSLNASYLSDEAREELDHALTSVFPQPRYDSNKDDQPLFLNPYCLQEGMPHTIPQKLLITKALNTEGGILKIASLYSVLPQHIAEWFDYETLEEANGNYLLPDSIEELTEQEIIELYPRLKIFAALNGFEIHPECVFSILRTEYYSDVNLLKILTVLDNISTQNDNYSYIYYPHLFRALNNEPDLDALQLEYVITGKLVVYGNMNIISNLIHSCMDTDTYVQPLVDWAERYSDNPLVLDACAQYYDWHYKDKKALSLWPKIFDLSNDENIPLLHIKTKAALKLVRGTEDLKLKGRIQDFVLKLQNLSSPDIYTKIELLMLSAHYGVFEEDHVKNLLDIVLDTHDLQHVEFQLTALCRTLYYAGQRELSTVMKDWLLEKGVQNTELAELLIISHDVDAKEYLLNILPTHGNDIPHILFLLSSVASESEVENLIKEYRLEDDTSLDGRLYLAFIYRNIGNHLKCEEYWGEVMRMIHQGGEEVDEMVEFFFQSFVEYGIIEEHQTNYFFELDTTTLLDGMMFVCLEEMKKLDD